MAPSRPVRLACVAALALAAAGALAQPMYRCGPDGRSFSQLPCDGGEAVSAAREPSAAQRAEATEVARREAALARQLADERTARESAARAPGAVAIRGTLMRKEDVRSRLGPKKKEKDRRMTRRAGEREERSSNSFGAVD